jgi:oligopeptide transport system substrate-binding protein
MGRIALPFVFVIGVVAATVLTDRKLPPADFTFINRGDVTTLDLQRMSWMQDLRVARMVFEGLVSHDVFTWGYDIAPAVAERWEVSEDQLTYTFHLREDAKWSNGEPVRASDFVYSWRRALLPDTASDYTGLFQLIDGAGEFFEWRSNATSEYANRPASERTPAAAEELWRRTKTKFDEMVSLRALDERTLMVRLTEPTPYFLDLCAFAVFFPVYPPLVQQYEHPQADTGLIKIESGWTKPGRLISNGPFILTEWRFKRDMFFERNPHYWDPGAANVDTIKIVSVEDGNAQVLAFETGSVDWVSDVGPSYRGDMVADKMRFYREHWDAYQSLLAAGYDQFEIDRRLPSDPRKNIHAIPAFGTYWYNFNCEPKLQDGRDNPFSDPRVRRAFAMCIDKQSIVDDVMRIGNPVARTLIPPNSIGGYQSPRGLRCVSDAQSEQEKQEIIDEAKRLLAEAGYPDPGRFMTVEILFNKDGGHDLVAQAVQRDWQKYLGVPVTLAMKEVKVFRDDLKKQNFMVSRAGWYGDYGDPTTFLDLSRKDDGNNDRKYYSERYESLLDRAKLERDPEARMDLLEEAERIIMEEDLPMVPLFHYVTLYLFDAHRVSGINPHPRTEQQMHLVDILGDGKGAETPKFMRPLLPIAPGSDGAGEG